MGFRSSPHSLAALVVVGSSLLGLALLASAWRACQAQSLFIADSWSVRASIVALEPIGGDFSRGAPVVSFTTMQGAKVRITLPGADLALGDTVNLLYDEENPEDVRINQYWSLWFEPWALGIAGGLLVAVPLTAWVWYRGFRRSASTVLL